MHKPEKTEYDNDGSVQREQKCVHWTKIYTCIVNSINRLHLYSSKHSTEVKVKVAIGKETFNGKTKLLYVKLKRDEHYILFGVFCCMICMDTE